MEYDDEEEDDDGDGDDDDGDEDDEDEDDNDDNNNCDYLNDDDDVDKDNNVDVSIRNRLKIYREKVIVSTSTKILMHLCSAIYYDLKMGFLVFKGGCIIPRYEDP